MKRFLLIAALALSAPAAQACDFGWSIVKRSCENVSNAWNKGEHELIVSGYSYHLRSTYTPEKLRELNERSWGLGYARTYEDKDGDDHSLMVFGFKDSHSNIQWNAGYSYHTYWGRKGGLQPGLGFAAILVQRPDIANGWPFPALVPMATVKWGKAAMNVIYIPTLNNGINNGSVVYAFGRYRF